LCGGASHAATVPQATRPAKYSDYSIPFDPGGIDRLTTGRNGVTQGIMSNEKTIHVAARFPAELVARVDAFLEGKAEPGKTITRSDAIRMLVTRALDALAAEQPAKRRR
jgi:hypothetical protein